MSKKLFSILQYAFFLGLGIFLLWLTLRKSDWNSIISDLSDANYIFLIPATLMLVVSHFIRALRWKILMEPLGYKPSTLNTFLAVFVGYWANLAVPRLGEVLKCTILARYEKVPADKLIGTIVAERAIDVCSLIVIMVITVFSQYNLIGGFAKELFTKFFTSRTGNFSLFKVGVFVLILVSFILLFICANQISIPNDNPFSGVTPYKIITCCMAYWKEPIPPGEGMIIPKLPKVSADKAPFMPKCAMSFIAKNPI